MLDDIEKGSKIHFCGIGGSAMNGMAIMLASQGYHITGTDPGIDSATRSRLAGAGIAASEVQDGSGIPPDVGLVIATAAVPEGHPELAKAAGMGIPVIKYARMLGVLMNSFTGIAVAGTHGKTTTSAMTVAALRGVGRNPGYVIGGFVPQFGAGAGTGGSRAFVAEACEYDKSFLNLRPQIAVVTNIEADHLDIYEDLDAIIRAFQEFASNVTKDGVLIHFAQSPGAVALADAFEGRVVSYGMGGSEDYTAANVLSEEGLNRFDVVHGGETIARVELQLPGRHNVQNALGAFCAAHSLGCAPRGIAQGLGAFKGVARRFEVLGERSGVTVVDDYAHHPTEIRAFLKGVKERFPGRRVIAAFQPHQISRTKFLFDEFAASFGDADLVLLPDIYAARDKERPSEITSERLALKVSEAGVDCRYSGDLETTRSVALDVSRAGDVFCTIGAGDIFQVAHHVYGDLGD